MIKLMVPKIDENPVNKRTNEHSGMSDSIRQRKVQGPLLPQIIGAVFRKYNLLINLFT